MMPAQRFNRFMNRVYDRLRHEEAFGLADSWEAGSSSGAGLAALRGNTYVTLVSFRRNGEAVPSPVWFAVDSDRILIRTTSDSAKVKRIANDSRVLLAPTTMRGRPKGPPVGAVARLLPREEWQRAEAVLVGAYGLGRKVYEGLLGEPDHSVAYLELRSGADDPDSTGSGRGNS